MRNAVGPREPFKYQAVGQNQTSAVRQGMTAAPRYIFVIKFLVLSTYSAPIVMLY
jgi:hypothetical protein